jgi:hypothetical protein
VAEPSTTTCPLARDDLEVNEVEDGLVVYDTARDRVHYLDESASLVFALCTGTNTEAVMVEQIASAFGLPATDVATDVASCLAMFEREGILA